MDFFWLSKTHALAQWSARATLMSTHWLQQLGQSLRTSQRVLMTFWLINKAFELLTHLKTSLKVLFSQMFDFQPGHLISLQWELRHVLEVELIESGCSVNEVIIDFPILTFCMEGWRA